MAKSSRPSRSRDVSVTSHVTAPRQVSSRTTSDSPATIVDVDMAETGNAFLGVEIDPGNDFERDEYMDISGETAVQKVLQMEDVDGEFAYKIRLGHFGTEVVSFEQLLTLDSGMEALTKFEEGMNSLSDAESNAASGARVRERRTRKKAALPNYVDRMLIDDSDDDQNSRPSRRAGTRLRITNKHEPDFAIADSESEAGSEEEEEEEDRPRRSGRNALQPHTTRQSRLSFNNHKNRPRTKRFVPIEIDDDDEEEDEDSSADDGGYSILQSDIVPRRTKARRLVGKSQSRRDEREPKEASRRSERTTRPFVNMADVGEDEEQFRSDSEPTLAPPKASGAKEAFKSLPRGNRFRERHMQICDTCKNFNNSAGQLVYCQGCILAYHKSCLGHRTGREHLVTKVGDEDFILQCRRCINIPKKKDRAAPDLSKCQDCGKLGPSCKPFRKVKSAQVEQREREENNGDDPITYVDPSLINNANNVLFRCTSCSRAFHFHHLESRNPYTRSVEQDDHDRANTRFSEYSKDWFCKDCADMPAKIGGLIAWRPDDVNNDVTGRDVSIIPEDEKEYLIKWEDMSYFRAQWMPGAWTWGVSAPAMRRAFFNRTMHPKMRTEDAIPEEWLRIDIVLDVKYTNRIDIHGLEIDKARIKEVDTALIKYKGLGYEDAVWEKVPGPEDGDRWTDFVIAYNDWVLGRYTTLPSASHLKSRLEKVRSQPFKEKIKQPENVEGGELMKYQLEGLNWLYYQWYQQKNGILADEMGLGKTIQIIAFLAMMVQDHKCYPFLVVVPNSTCPNWRREIKKWAPQLRVVTYFGSAAARKMALDYELFPEGSKTLKCHAVITSYEAATDTDARRFFKGVQWQGLIVDEGQRLKNDQSQLHMALNSLKIPFRILLTGTPLQNNARELFNLLQFLDDKIDAAKMEEDYAEMTNEKINRLHDLIRPFILRRTKLQVLSFLPPMAQIILPVSMTTLQKKTYKSILAQSPELIKALFSTQGIKATERVNLNNILMQLRKCLCHPFVFKSEIEETGLDKIVTHRNLVEASPKLQLLELLLPKLRERGHRVLIFSQFLDMLDIIEDFLEGMSLQYQRLDGRINSLEKQKRIDEFNAPNSSLFAFLLSTRAGGVGINLASADTVIILDPDFNPHQDIQAISRAHRIGQTKKVLCFQLTTRNSAEEKIMQIGRKKMALDEVVINKLDEEDVEEKDMESILKHGMAELFNEDDAEQVIRYDEASIDKLLDRSQMENTKTKDNTAESQFSFARIWANDAAALQEESLDLAEKEERAPDKTFWDAILKERAAKLTKDATNAELGRGLRQKTAINYNIDDRGNRVPDADGDEDMDEAPDHVISPVSPEKVNRRKRHRHNADSDTDFQASDGNNDASEDEGHEAISPKELAAGGDRHGAPGGAVLGSQSKKTKAPEKAFSRSNVKPAPLPPSNPNARLPNGKLYPKVRRCPACNNEHLTGSCPLKTTPLERCNICGLAHFGYARVCPHFKSETMVRTMLDALKQSREPKYVVDAANKYLRGLKGHLVQEKRRALEKPTGTDGTAPRLPLSPTQGVPPIDGRNGQSYTTPYSQQSHQHQQPLEQEPLNQDRWASLPVEERLRIMTSTHNY